MSRPQGPEEFPLGQPLEFLRRLWRLNHALERLSGRMAKELGVTAQQRLVIRCLGKYPGITAGQLARLLHVDPGTISATLRRLEQRRLIERPRDPVDNRRVALGLTKKGRALDVPAAGTVESAVEALLASGTAAEAKVVIGMLERFTALLERAAS